MDVERLFGAVPRYRIFVRGFPKGVSEKSLREHFEPCGEIREVQLPKKKDFHDMRSVWKLNIVSKTWS